jgi:hypothetical protein
MHENWSKQKAQVGPHGLDVEASHEEGGGQQWSPVP